jgi:ABC-2 type transport system permease protein
MRLALLEDASTAALVPSLIPTLLLGAAALPIGIAVFGWGERYAKRTGRLKRSG